MEWDHGLPSFHFNTAFLQAVQISHSLVTKPLRCHPVAWEGSAAHQSPECVGSRVPWAPGAQTSLSPGSKISSTSPLSILRKEGHAEAERGSDSRFLGEPSLAKDSDLSEDPG